MHTIFGIPNCDTVKKTLDWFKENQVPYIFHDYKKEGIALSKLESWLAQQPVEVLVNRAGTTFKALNDAQKASIQDPEKATQLMQEFTSIIKRPIIEKDGAIIKVGWKPASL
jgi:arsenate reductase (glutaredoxin)